MTAQVPSATRESMPPVNSRPPLSTLDALEQRLRAAAAVALPGRAEPQSDDPGHRCAALLADLLAACPSAAGPEHWLAWTAVAGRFARVAEVARLARTLRLDGVDPTIRMLLTAVRAEADKGCLDLPMRVVTDQTVVVVDYSARHELNTGIQRVARATTTRWVDSRPIVPVAVTDEHTGLRLLHPRESARVLHYGTPWTGAPDDRSEDELVVPWRTSVVFLEVPDPWSAPSMAAMAECSGNRVGLVAYDMIPLLSADYRPRGESGIFASYLGLVKHSHRVAGISRSAADEFRGFSAMLPAQGLAGPHVTEVELAEEVDHSGKGRPPRAGERPVVMATARREPHKNLRAVLHAVERLWNEGLDFEFVMLGSTGWDESAVSAWIARLTAAGRPIEALGWVPDDEMWQRIGSASFVVFTSLHEGYGLPVAEALACGTPVVTTRYGSQGEIAEKGGCVLVDPRDDADITGALRTLITQPQRVLELRAQIAGRPRRSWDDYAADLWRYLVEDDDAQD